MFKYLATITFAFLLSMFTASAKAPDKKIFAGKYDGIARLESVTGESIFYSPVRFKIAKNGKITGTAFKTSNKKLLKVTGKINKVKSQFNILYTAKASGKFADGTKWTAEITAQKGVSSKVIKGKAKKNRFEGDLTLTN